MSRPVGDNNMMERALLGDMMERVVSWCMWPSMASGEASDECHGRAVRSATEGSYCSALSLPSVGRAVIIVVMPSVGRLLVLLRCFK